MKRFVFAALMTSLGLTVAGLAPARPAQQADRVVRSVRTPAVTWTCAHNKYRSLGCR
jgi:hypothetical protein